MPDGRCTFTASSLAAAGVVHALLGLVCGRLKPGGWRRCVRGAFGDLCLGRPYTSRVWRALRMGAAGSQTCAGGGGGGGGEGGYAAVWHERDPRGGGTLTRCATGDVRVLPRVCVFACGFSKILAQPCLSFGFARRGGAGEPLFLLLLRELSGKLAWLSVALKTSVRNLMQRAHIFLLRVLCNGRGFSAP